MAMGMNPEIAGLLHMPQQQQQAFDINMMGMMGMGMGMGGMPMGMNGIGRQREVPPVAALTVRTTAVGPQAGGYRRRRGA